MQTIQVWVVFFTSYRYREEQVKLDCSHTRNILSFFQRPTDLWQQVKCTGVSAAFRFPQFSHSTGATQKDYLLRFPSQYVSYINTVYPLMLAHALTLCIHQCLFTCSLFTELHAARPQWFTVLSLQHWSRETKKRPRAMSVVVPTLPAVPRYRMTGSELPAVPKASSPPWELPTSNKLPPWWSQLQASPWRKRN